MTGQIITGVVTIAALWLMLAYSYESGFSITKDGTTLATISTIIGGGIGVTEYMRSKGK